MNATGCTAGDAVYTAGPGGDFSTLNAALAHASARIRTYSPGGLSTVIVLRSGYVMAEQVLVKNLDLGFITISAEDAVVPIARSYLTTPLMTGEGEYDSYPAFGAHGGTLPVLDALFEMDTSGILTMEDIWARDGVALYNHARATIRPARGVTNASGCGLMVRMGSSATAPNTVWRGGVFGAVRADELSFISLAYQNNETLGTGADCRDCWADAILAREGSIIDARGADASGGSYDGIHARRGSAINAANAISDNQDGAGVRADMASRVNFDGGRASGCKFGVESYRESGVQARNANISGSAKNGLHAWQGGRIVASGSNARKSANADTGGNNGDIRVTEGSFIVANNALGGTNQAKNTLTANGCIFG